MNNHSNEENTDNSSDKKSPAFKVLESNAEKFLILDSIVDNKSL